MSDEERTRDTLPPGDGFLDVQQRMALFKVIIQLCHVALSDAKEEDFTPAMRAELDQLILELTTLP